MSTLVEVICPFSQESAQNIIEQHFEQTGDRLLACCAYEGLDRVLLVAQILPTTNQSEHVAFLRLALQKGIIESYEYLTCYLMSAFLDPARDRNEQMRCFPLRDGESWLPAIDHPNKVYICLDKPYMASDQTLWLAKYQVQWMFEDI